jgi:hypothetical protein
MNPQHALMQELATARQADLLREAQADREAAAAGPSSTSAPPGGAGPAERLVFWFRARRRRRPGRLSPQPGA